MSEKKYVVPEGMLKAAKKSGQNADGFTTNNLCVCIEAALCWWSENAQLPTLDQVEEYSREWERSREWSNRLLFVIKKWQSEMFLAPEPKIPIEIRDLMPSVGTPNEDSWRESVIEAYRRGKESR